MVMNLNVYSACIWFNNECDNDLEKGGMMNWRDYTAVFAICFMLVVIGVVIADIPLVQQISWTWASVAVTLLGLLMFGILSPIMAPTSKPESMTTALLALTALILAVSGWIVNSKVLFLALCINLVVLWVLSTIYHVQAHEGGHLHQ